MIESTTQTRCTAFQGFKCLATGSLSHVATKIKEISDQNPEAGILVFDDTTSHPIEFDLRGTVQDVLARLEAKKTPDVAAPEAVDEPSARGPGRPRLGVVAREVTLLPRHWDWLAKQDGGASVALRKLVEEARRTHAEKDQCQAVRESAYRFMSAIAGNLPGFEEATRALFAGNEPKFNALLANWPADLRNHAKKLATGAFKG